MNPLISLECSEFHDVLRLEHGSVEHVFLWNMCFQIRFILCARGAQDIVRVFSSVALSSSLISLLTAISSQSMTTIN